MFGVWILTYCILIHTYTLRIYGHLCLIIMALYLHHSWASDGTYTEKDFFFRDIIIPQRKFLFEQTKIYFVLNIYIYLRVCQYPHECTVITFLTQFYSFTHLISLLHAGKPLDPCSQPHTARFLNLCNNSRQSENQSRSFLISCLQADF